MYMIEFPSNYISEGLLQKYQIKNQYDYKNEPNQL